MSLLVVGVQVKHDLYLQYWQQLQYFISSFKQGKSANFQKNV